MKADTLNPAKQRVPSIINQSLKMPSPATQEFKFEKTGSRCYKGYPHFFALFSIGFIMTFNVLSATAQQNPGWCGRNLRKGLEQLREVKTSRRWFKVYDLGHHVYAIDEPYNWEETIGYLILGRKQALMFDTGMGMDSVSLVVKELTKLPVTVLNSHTHPDHIGSNFEFRHILAMKTVFTRYNAVNGYAHDAVKWEVSPGAFCQLYLPRLDTGKYFIRPFGISKFIHDGYLIELGGRTLKVIATPGHTPDAICLYDPKAGYLWCGDSFYEGPILLSDEHTDLSAYLKSIHLIARYAARSTRVLPAHNLPSADRGLVIQAAKGFDQIVCGAKKGKSLEAGVQVFDFGKFSYQIGSRFLPPVLPIRSSR